jgi:hypothetical protein
MAVSGSPVGGDQGVVDEAGRPDARREGHEDLSVDAIDGPQAVGGDEREVLRLDAEGLHRAVCGRRDRAGVALAGGDGLLGGVERAA